MGGDVTFGSEHVKQDDWGGEGRGGGVSYRFLVSSSVLRRLWQCADVLCGG